MSVSEPAAIAELITIGMVGKCLLLVRIAGEGGLGYADSSLKR